MLEYLNTTVYIVGWLGLGGIACITFMVLKLAALDCKDWLARRRVQ